MKHLHLFRIGFYIVTFLTIAFKSVEKAYLYFFKKPLFIHFYVRKRSVSHNQKRVLESEVKFYRELDKKNRSYFEHRLFKFLEKYEFIGRDGFQITDASKVILGAVYVMMTFGMRHYLTHVFNKIIIYPDAFISRTNKALHKGEFNPMLKIVVFSWKDVIQGREIEDDNLHLGIHEFAHVLSMHAKTSSDSGAEVFRAGLDELVDFLSVKKNLYYIRNLGYIREYAFTNSFEFIAVLLEYFFESPEIFKKLLPDVYDIISRMLNYKHILTR